MPFSRKGDHQLDSIELAVVACNARGLAGNMNSSLLLEVLCIAEVIMLDFHALCTATAGSP